MSTKTKKITVTNFKAISALEIDFNGCTGIITGGNNKGKSSLLRGITDRIRGLKPELIVKQGEKEGNGTIELTSGEKFMWEFDIEGTDKLIFVTKDGYKTKVTKEISKRFFPVSFDIDKFLNDSPKEQSKQLQKIVGINFAEIDARYALAYADRTEKNREAERFQAKLITMFECPKVDAVDLTELQTQKTAERTRLNSIYTANKKLNDEARNKWNEAKDIVRAECELHNDQQTQNRIEYNVCYDAAEILKNRGFVLIEALSDFLHEKKKLILNNKDPKEFYPIEPSYIDEVPKDDELQKIDAQILTASQTNVEAQAYTDYIVYKTSVENAKSDALDADIKVKAIETERENLIKTAKMPKGIAFGIEGIEVDGFPLDKNQISTSKLYCAALRIASLNIGEVRTLHFDASSLDNVTLGEIQVWAHENDLQLLIERIAIGGDEIKYEIVEN